MKYRLYIDEVGDPGLKAVKDPRYRYLCLTGIIMELDYVNNIVFHELESLKKKYFHSHVDDPVILHRKELVNKRYPFQALRAENIKDAFDKDLLHLLNSLDYKVITVVIDKLEHKMRYQTWQQDPYHYSLRVLLERYILFLEKIGLTKGEIKVDENEADTLFDLYVEELDKLSEAIDNMTLTEEA